MEHSLVKGPSYTVIFSVIFFFICNISEKFYVKIKELFY